MKAYTLLFFILFWLNLAVAQKTEYKMEKDLIYSSNSDKYSLDLCKLDLYYPSNAKDFVTLIWFHGGGLTAGGKEIPEYLKDKNIAIVGVGYRLSPKVAVSEILNDGADAVKWVFDNVERIGGSKQKIVIGGMSAGAYISLMLGLNQDYLEKRNLNSDDILGIVSFSAQTITHYTARAEVGREGLQPTVDVLAPLFWVRKDAPKMLLITGDREMELMGRYEENAYLWRMLKLAGHKDVKLHELEGYGHDMAYPAYPLLMEEIRKWNK